MKNCSWWLLIMLLCVQSSLHGAHDPPCDECIAWPNWAQVMNPSLLLLISSSQGCLLFDSTLCTDNGSVSLFLHFRVRAVHTACEKHIIIQHNEPNEAAGKTLMFNIKLIHSCHLDYDLFVLQSYTFGHFFPICVNLHNENWFSFFICFSVKRELGFYFISAWNKVCCCALRLCIDHTDVEIVVHLHLTAAAIFTSYT